jgi:hypothetical protein
MALDNSTPIPPAPTRPSVTAERIAFSTLKSDVAVIEAKLPGRIAPMMTESRPAPVEVSAWDGPVWTSSKRSEKNRAAKPMVPMMMARSPASGPRPTATTKIRAQISNRARHRDHEARLGPHHPVGAGVAGGEGCQRDREETPEGDA